MKQTPELKCPECGSYDLMKGFRGKIERNMIFHYCKKCRTRIRVYYVTTQTFSHCEKDTLDDRKFGDDSIALFEAINDVKLSEEEKLKLVFKL